jgi:hypothetical protein
MRKLQPRGLLGSLIEEKTDGRTGGIFHFPFVICHLLFPADAPGSEQRSNEQEAPNDK